jgi:hypothetical protein
MPSVSSTKSKTKSARQSRIGRFVRGLSPYQALVILLVPLSVVEPLKLIAVAAAGEGHWLAGTTMAVVAYAASLLVVERIFRLVKPKLLTLPWFARMWSWFVRLRSKARVWLTRLMPSQTAPPPAAPHRRMAKPERQ